MINGLFATYRYILQIKDLPNVNKVEEILNEMETRSTDTLRLYKEFGFDDFFSLEEQFVGWIASLVQESE